jgi:hypothetical protein
MTAPSSPSKPKTPIWRQRWVLPVATGLIGILIGSAAAGGGADATTPAVPAPAPAPTVTVTTTATATVTAEPEKPTPAPTKDKAEDQTKGGLDAYGALEHCGNAAETGLKNEFPASKVKVHTLMGILAQEYRAKTDDWFIKVEASVDDNRVNVECVVSGSETSPSLDNILWY